MGDHEQVLSQAAGWLERGVPVALASVVSTWGSSPRPPGSLLAVSGAGALAGSVSAGCVEAAVVEEALAVLRAGAPRLVRHGVTDERAWSVGLACGGTIELYLEPLAPPRFPLQGLLEALAARRPAVLVTDLGSGATRLLDPAALPADLGEPLRAAAREVVERDRAARRSDDGVDRFLRPFAPPVRVAIVGAVHVAQALAPMVRLAGHDPLVIDPRTAFATAARFPGIALSTDWPDAALSRLAPDRRTAVVALTHDPKLDDPALAAALRTEAFYVGALGSTRTHAARLERLRAEGFTDPDLARIHGPVGLRIGAVTPGEIAASVLAELIAALRTPAPGR